MKKAESYIPKGYHTVTPYIIVDGAAKALEFYKKALGATEVFRMDGPDGKIMHSEFNVGDSRMMMADEFPDMGMKGPKNGGTSVSFMVYVEDVDFVAKQAIEAGMTEKRAVKDQFYGDRSGTFQDPFGHVWTIGTHIEELTTEEMNQRAAQAKM